MAMSKLNKEDAQEWLESLQQVGEGWYRGVMVAVRANAHRSLGMDRRDFIATIGQKMIDPTDAVIELYNEQPKTRKNVQIIADVLGINPNTANRILAEAGLVEAWTRNQPAISGKATDSPSKISGKAADYAGREAEEYDADELVARIEELELTLKGQKKKAADERRELKDEIAEYQRERNNALRDAKKKAQEALTDQERKRAEKEADAWAQEQGELVLTGFTNLIVSQVTDALREAGEGISELMSRGGLTREQLTTIEQAHASFVEEMNIARMSERS